VTCGWTDAYSADKERVLAKMDHEERYRHEVIWINGTRY